MCKHCVFCLNIERSSTNSSNLIHFIKENTIVNNISTNERYIFYCKKGQKTMHVHSLCLLIFYNVSCSGTCTS